MARIEDVSNEILVDLLTDFAERELPAGALHDGYDGVKTGSLRERCSGSSVDFELALKDLEKRELIKTGPWEMYDNPPNSSIVVFAMFSKREFAYLTEKGYRAAQQASSPKQRRSRPSASVHISGSHFHQSPVGIGSNIHQSVSAQPGEFQDLARALADLGIPADEIDSLHHAVEQDQAEGGKASFDGKTGAWFAKLLGRASQGALGVGVDLVTGSVSKLLSGFIAGS